MSELLKRTIYETLRDWGHDIYLQRFDRSSQSYPHDRDPHDDVDVPTVLEKHTVRSWTETALFHADRMFVAGLGTNYDITYVMLADAKPKEQDRIYEEDTGLGEQSIYRIDAVEPKRGRFGEVIFYAVGATRVSPT